MNRTLALSLSAALLFCVGDIVSPRLSAQEDPPPPPPPGPSKVEDAPKTEAAPPAKRAVSDPEAIAFVRRAAERQGAVTLAKKAGLQSFHVQFASVKVARETTGADGTKTNVQIELDPNGLEIDWMAPNLIRTHESYQGVTKTRGFDGAKYWLDDDGTDVVVLRGERYESDRSQIDHDQRLIRAMLDIVFLGRMLEDGSVWKLVTATVREGYVGVRRIPPAASEGVGMRLPLTVWLDKSTFDPTFVEVEPSDPEYPTLHYTFAYHERYPTVTSAEQVRFPFSTWVEQQWEKDGPKEEILVVNAGAVEFNGPSVTATTFKMPRRRPRAPK